MSIYYRHLDTVAEMNGVDEIFYDFLQCPTISSPSAIKEDFMIEPLDFLPLSKEKRDQITATNLVLEVTSRLNRQINNSTANQTKESIENSPEPVKSSAKNLISIEDLQDVHAKNRRPSFGTKSADPSLMSSKLSAFDSYQGARSRSTSIQHPLPKLPARDQLQKRKSLNRKASKPFQEADERPKITRPRSVTRRT